MRERAFISALVLLAGCTSGGSLKFGPEGELVGKMADAVYILGSANPSFRWTDLRDRIAYDLKEGKSPRRIALGLLKEGSDLNKVLNRSIYLPIARVFSGNEYLIEDGDETVAAVSCAWTLSEGLRDSVNAMLSRNKYEAVENLQKGLVQYVFKVLSSDDPDAPIRATAGAMAYSCFHAMAEEKGEVKLPFSVSAFYYFLAENRPEVLSKIEQVFPKEEGEAE